MLSVLEKSQLSPEQLGEVLGLSGMTLRRWKKEKPGKKVPKAYESTIVEGVYRLIVDGRLKADAPEVQGLLQKSGSLSIAASMQGMGVRLEDLDQASSQQDRLAEVLSRIGLSEVHRDDVERDHAKISGYKKMGSDWKRFITRLLEVIKSTEFSTTEKFVAYGALFYLINPFDLIPDHIPIFGLMDDFAVLGVAFTFYGKHAKRNFLKSSVEKSKKTDKSG